MKINVYGYDRNNKLIAVSAVTGEKSSVDEFINIDLPMDQGFSLMSTALEEYEDVRHKNLARTLVYIETDFKES